jgi:hypothetical protein
MLGCSINFRQLCFISFSSVSQGTFRKATWRGILVAVKKLDDDLIMDENKVWVGSIE